MKIEAEITPGRWIEVQPHQLTDDIEVELDPNIDPKLLVGTKWYLGGDYTSFPVPIRVLTTKKHRVKAHLSIEIEYADDEALEDLVGELKAILCHIGEEVDQYSGASITDHDCDWDETEDNGRKPFTVFGFYPDTGQRFCDMTNARNAENAEGIMLHDTPGLAIVGTIEGGRIPAETETQVTTWEGKWEEA